MRLSAATANGFLAEDHYLDIKRELPSGQAANRELTRDLASFAIDGGFYVIGVDEAGGPPTLHPVTLSRPALAERVEQAVTSLQRAGDPSRKVAVARACSYGPTKLG